MALINQITPEDIKRLNPINLSILLLRLLSLEAIENKLTDEKISVPFNITTGDGGEDGSISWSNTPKSTRKLPRQYVLFQNKATDFSPSQCAEELLEKKIKQKPRTLKSQIQKVVDNDGAYILFTTQLLNPKGIQSRIEQFRRGLKIGNCIKSDILTIDVYDANIIAQWVNQYLAAVTLVQKINGIDRPNGFQGYEDWAKKPSLSETVYRSNAKLDGFKAEILTATKSFKKIRISGHSGLGKTRLLFEVFSDDKIRETVVYYDLAGITDIKNIKDYFLSHQHHQSGIIIVDNCTVNIHNILSALTDNSSKLLLITIGFDDNDSVEDAKIKLERKNQFEIVNEIIVDQLGATHSHDDINYLNNLCEGYPWMAARFCKNIKKLTINDFSATLPHDFIEKLLFGGVNNDKDYKIIRGCSVFSSFGFPDDNIRPIITKEQADLLTGQLEYLRTVILDGSVSYNDLYETCQRYKRDDIMERQGLYYTVKPSVLAINLAADWLIHTPHHKIINILNDHKGSELVNKFVERFKDLDQIDKAIEIVNELWGPGRFFVSAEVLNTSWGSLLFRNVVEVNSMACALGLFETFSTTTKDNLLKMTAGRRNIVWALEKLAFKRETFSIAARILYKFAVAENENWSNNATFQFRQLFSLYLSGTQADYNKRVEILLWGLQQNDDDFTKLAVTAAGTGLSFDRFSRMGGAEKQGSRAPMKDYEPPNNETVLSYWSALIEIIKPVAVSKDPLGLFARDTITDVIRSLVSHGQIDLIVNLVRDVFLHTNILWTEAISKLKQAIQYEKPGNQDKEKIQTLIEELQLSDIKSQILLKISSPEWSELESSSEGGFIDKAKLNAEAFAEYICKNDIDLTEFIPSLLKGQQQQAFNFGVRLGQLASNKKAFLDYALASLKQIRVDEQNPDIISGFLNGSNDDQLFDNIMNNILYDPKVNQHSFYLTRNYKITYRNVFELFILIDDYKFPITSFKTFQYGTLDPLSDDEIFAICNKICLYGAEGKWVVVTILYTICYRNKEKWHVYGDYLAEIVAGENLLLHVSKVGTMDSFYWHQTLAKVLHDSNNIVLATEISLQIIEYCAEQKYTYAFDTGIFKVIVMLFDEYFREVWKIFGSAFSGDYFPAFRLKNLLWNHDSNAKSKWIFDKETRSSFVLSWLRHQDIKTVARIANFAPIGSNADEEYTWHPFTEKLLNEFGNIPSVLNELSANMGTFGTVGSSRGYYIKQKKLLLQLFEHHILEVRDWANKMLSYTELNLKRSELDDEML